MLSGALGGFDRYRIVYTKYERLNYHRYIAVATVALKYVASEVKRMEPDLQYEREQVHLLIDGLSSEKLTVVKSLLTVMIEPLSQSLAAAPVEEEEITPDTAAALDRARASIARGEIISHEDILSEFGR